MLRSIEAIGLGIARLYGLKIKDLSNPRDYQKNTVELVEKARHTIKAVVSSTELYAWGLPEFATPDTWEKVAEMHKKSQELAGKSLVITEKPHNFSPELFQLCQNIAIPFSPETTVPPMLYITPELEPFNITPDNQGTCYAVRLGDVALALSRANPEGTQQWIQSQPNWQEDGLFLVNTETCLIVNVV